MLNLLSPNCDENEISLYLIITCSSIQVMRIKEMISKNKMS